MLWSTELVSLGGEFHEAKGRDGDTEDEVVDKTARGDTEESICIRDRNDESVAIVWAMAMVGWISGTLYGAGLTGCARGNWLSLVLPLCQRKCPF